MGKVKQKQEKRKKEIIEIVLRLAEDTPFDEISIADICEACDISVGSFYHYFNRKSDLLVGFFNLIDDYMEEHIFPQMTSENELENLRIFFNGWATHVLDNGIERSRLLSSSKPVDYDQQKGERPIRRKLVEVVERAQTKGQIANVFTPEKIADMLLVAARGITIDWSRRDGSYSLAQGMDDFIRFMLNIPE